MARERRPLWHSAREFATHWLVGGVILAATGFVPEEWLARVMSGLRVPAEALHLWGTGSDLRLALVGPGSAVVVGDVAWRHRRRGAAAANPPAGPVLPDRPSIAVLPFANLSGGPEQAYFSDGVADDIITELSRERSLFVIARNSSFTYRGRDVDVRQVARELGVRYVLEGSARREGARVRVNAQLIDAASGSHVWAERYDRDVSDLFAMQDEITRAVVAAIQPAVAGAELQRAMRRPPGSLSAWEAYQRGLGCFNAYDPEQLARARGFFTRAVELDSGFARAYAGIAMTLVAEFGTGSAGGMLDFLAPAERHARKAVATDPADADALASLSAVLGVRGEHAMAVELGRRAVALNPNSTFAMRNLGSRLLFTGDAAEARTYLREALRLSPRDPLAYNAQTQIAISYYVERNYIGAERAVREAIGSQPENFIAFRWLACALGQQGRAAEANAALRKALAATPAAAMDFFVHNRAPWVSPEAHEHMLEGMRKAGWEG